MLGCPIIKYPTSEHEAYIGFITKYCKENSFSLILKGSLAKGMATVYSDIDLIVLGRYY